MFLFPILYRESLIQKIKNKFLYFRSIRLKMFENAWKNINESKLLDMKKEWESVIRRNYTEGDSQCVSCHNFCELKHIFVEHRICIYCDTHIQPNPFNPINEALFRKFFPEYVYFLEEEKDCSECGIKVWYDYVDDYDLCRECYKTSSSVNRCIECRFDMGYCNPRQLCRKTYCDGF